MPSSTSGRAGNPTSGPDSVSTRWQKLWKFATVTRAAVAAPTASSIRVAELARGLDVVGQDQDLFGEEVWLSLRAARRRVRR